jgi:Tfp pilus assembly protein PilF
MNTFFSLIRFVYVNIIFIISTSGCQTITKPDKEKANTDEYIQSQKSLVISYINKGNPSSAYTELRELIRKHPNDPDFQNLMGLVYLVLEHPKQATKYFRRSIQLNMQPAVVLNLSSAYIESRQYNRALKLLSSLKKLDSYQKYPYPERVSHNIALAAERNKNLDMAEKYYKEALQENPQYYLSLIRLGKIYDSKGKKALAMTQYKAARSSCNLCYDATGAIIMNYLSQGKTSTAISTIKSYLSQTNLRDVDKNRANKLLVMAQKIKRNTKKKANIAKKNSNKPVN